MNMEEQREGVASAYIVLGEEDKMCVSLGPQGASSLLSAALVQLKGDCMKFLGEFLVRQNTPLEEPDEVLEESLSDDEEEEEAQSTSRN